MPADPKNVDKKVPTWDGDPDKWESFRDAVKWHNRKTPERERCSVAAHIAGNVTGKAWEHINRLSEEDQDKLADQGLDAVIKFFKDGLLENPIPEAGKHFREYVYKFRREKGESMKLYTARHTFQLGKLEKAMAGLKTSTVTLWSVVKARVQKYLDELPPSEEEAEEEQEQEVQTETQSSESLPGFPQTNEGGDEDTRSHRSRARSERSRRSGSQGRRSQQEEYTPEEWALWRAGRWVAPTETVKVVSKRKQLEDLLVEIGKQLKSAIKVKPLCDLLENFQEGLFPNQFLGWLVLQRSGLGPQERSVILAQSQGLELGPIEEALKRQWDDTELKEHDGKAKRFQERPAKRGRAFLGEEDLDSAGSETLEQPEYEEADVGAPDEPDDEEENDQLEFDVLHADYSDDEERDEAEEAMAMFRRARKDFKKSRRTLTQAKGLMKNIRRERKFVPRRRDRPAAHSVEPPPSSKGKGRQKRAPTPGRGRLRPKSPTPGAMRADAPDDSHLICFACGKTGHRAANCPKNAHLAEEEVQLAVEEHVMMLEEVIEEEAPPEDTRVADPPMVIPWRLPEVTPPRERVPQPMIEELEQTVGDVNSVLTGGVQISIEHWQDIMFKVCTEDISGNEEWFDPERLEDAIEWIHDSMWEELLHDEPPSVVHEEVLRRFFVRLIRANREGRINTGLGTENLSTIPEETPEQGDTLQGLQENPEEAQSNTSSESREIPIEYLKGGSSSPEEEDLRPWETTRLGRRKTRRLRRLEDLR